MMRQYPAQSGLCVTLEKTENQWLGAANSMSVQIELRDSSISKNGHALTFDLVHPSFHPSFALVILVVMVERKAEELAIAQALRIGVRVTVAAHRAEHLGTSCLEGGVELFDRIAKIVPVAIGITHSEDCHGLAAQIQPANLLKVIVPCSATALLISSSVPRWRAHDEPIEPRQVRSFHVANLLSLEACTRPNHASDLLCLAGLRTEEKAHGPHANEVASATGPRAFPCCHPCCRRVELCGMC